MNIKHEVEEVTEIINKTAYFVVSTNFNLDRTAKYSRPQ